MLLSSRVQPPKPLRPVSGTHLSIKQFLLHSPIPSPSLPSILPRHGKKPPPLNTKKALRFLSWLAIGVTTWWVLAFWCRRTEVATLTNLRSIPYLTTTGKSYEIVGGNELPDYAAPISITDEGGRRRWTISIPEMLQFPLIAADYADICTHADEVAKYAANHHKSAKQESHRYYHLDRTYIDVNEAQSKGLLPRPLNQQHSTHVLPLCQKSLTYVLDASDAGLGSSLLGLWLSIGLAQHEGRAFFLDDSTFAYGNFSTFFRLPSTATCRPPPKTQRVPCPRQAKHLVVSAATFPWTFGDSFNNHFSQKEIFDLARSGYQALFNVRKDDLDYVRSRMKTLRHESEEVQNMVIGIHLRRGDRHPFEFAYSRGYIPPRIYLETAQLLLTESNRSTIFVASDDPETYELSEFTGIARAQERITLATKRKLGKGEVGWEGGFFKDEFWGLGLPADAQDQKRAGSPLPTREKNDARRVSTRAGAVGMMRNHQTHPTAEGLQLREYIGRAYLIELMMLGNSDRVVCAVSSYACRIVAVMLGWERSFEQGHWKNVDGKYPWRALDM